MEVHVRNLPPQSTSGGIYNFLKPRLKALSIDNIHLTKNRGKKFASLTFLHVAEAEKFLDQHGQKRTEGTVVKRARVLLLFANSPVYFEKSTNEADPITLKGLEKEDKDRKSKNDVLTLPTTFTPVTFLTTSAACGHWTYVQSELNFAPQVNWDIRGSAKFGERGLILRLNSGARLDFRYGAVQEIMIQKSPAAITISMREPPRLFENIEKPLEDLLRELLIPMANGRPSPSREGPERNRVSFFNETDDGIAGNCLVYRLYLPQPVGHNNLHRQFQQLFRIPQMLPPTEHYIREKRAVTSPVEMMTRLMSSLSSSQFEIPFQVAFQIHKLARNNYLLPSTLLELLPEIVRMHRRSGTDVCVKSLIKICNNIEFPSIGVDGSDFQVDELIKELQQIETQAKSESFLVSEYQSELEDTTEINSLAVPKKPSRSDNEVMIHRVKVTPTGVFLSGPEPETNNRVLRKYPDHHDYFLRVTFCDEDFLPLRTNFKVSNYPILYKRFKGILDNGIEIAGRRFDFLGFSHSSLRMQTAWFMAPFIFDGILLFDRMVIRELGNFENITCPAKCAARIGQAFSDTPNTIKIDSHTVIEDVERNGRVFSDGVGTISQSLANRIYDGLRKKPLIRPTCFQIRFQGAKGMLAVDSKLSGEVMNLRPSMIKFKGSILDDLEICETAHKPLPLYLNRQFIKILEDMGVEDQYFLDLQAREVERLRTITQNPINASNFLKRQSIGEAILFPWLIEELDWIGLDFEQDGFLRDVVEVAILSELRQLKHKTRIPVPNGWHLHGIMDETGFLEEGEIFCSVVVDGQQQLVTGENLIVSRSPALHPGDVQLVNGVTPPEGSPLWKLSNCICFSQKGGRDLPSQLSGGDLDGDRFCIIFDKLAIPKHVYQPADYPRTEPLDINRVVQKQDMTDFFLQFMESDQLGQIAVLHRVLADCEESGTLHPHCVLLAEMHSTAVDFSKTGIPVDMSKLPRRPKFRPDFEAPGPHVTIHKLNGVSLNELEEIDPLEQEDEDDDMPRYRYYESEKILGKLYRAIDEKKIFAQIQRHEENLTSQSTLIDKVWEYVQDICRLYEWKHLTDWARDIREMYEDSLLSVMIDYSDRPGRPLSELESFVGSILGRSGAQNRTQHNISTQMKQRVEENNRFIVSCILKEGTERSTEALERSMACLAVSLEEGKTKRKDQLLSFKYVAAALCLREVGRFQAGL